MALKTTRANATTYRKYMMISRSGERTAEDFKIEIGFQPLKVLVMNLTDGVSAQWDPISGNDLQLVIAATGARSYEDGGIAVNGREVSITVATVGLETDDAVVLIEIWG